MKWLRRLGLRSKERNRVVNLRAVRVHKREPLPGFYDYGDIEFNRARSEALRKKAQQEGDG